MKTETPETSSEHQAFNIEPSDIAELGFEEDSLSKTISLPDDNKFLFQDLDDFLEKHANTKNQDIHTDADTPENLHRDISDFSSSSTQAQAETLVFEEGLEEQISQDQNFEISDDELDLIHKNIFGTANEDSETNEKDAELVLSEKYFRYSKKDDNLRIEKKIESESKNKTISESSNIPKEEMIDLDKNSEENKPHNQEEGVEELELKIENEIIRDGSEEEMVNLGEGFKEGIPDESEEIFEEKDENEELLELEEKMENLVNSNDNSPEELELTLKNGEEFQDAFDLDNIETSGDQSSSFDIEEDSEQESEDADAFDLDDIETSGDQSSSFDIEEDPEQESEDAFDLDDIETSEDQNSSFDIEEDSEQESENEDAFDLDDIETSEDQSSSFDIEEDSEQESEDEDAFDLGDIETSGDQSSSFDIEEDSEQESEDEDAFDLGDIKTGEDQSSSFDIEEDSEQEDEDTFDLEDIKTSEDQSSSFDIEEDSLFDLNALKEEETDSEPEEDKYNTATNQEVFDLETEPEEMEDLHLTSEVNPASISIEQTEQAETSEIKEKESSENLPKEEEDEDLFFTQLTSSIASESDPEEYSEEQIDISSEEQIDISGASEETHANQSSEMIDISGPDPEELANLTQSGSQAFESPPTQTNHSKSRLKIFENLPYSLKISLGSANVFGREIEEIEPGKIIKFTGTEEGVYDLFLSDCLVAKCKLVDPADPKKGLEIIKTMI